MHPYRTSTWAPEPAPCDDGSRVAFGVMAFAGGVEVAIALSCRSSLELMFGTVCVVAGLWLRRRAR